METTQLSCFIMVSQTLNFSEAARRCRVSQPTISRYVSELEREFGVQLFARSRRDVMLTDEGRALLPYAREVMQTLSRAKSVVAQLREGGTGRISVGYDATSGVFPVRCLQAFAAAYPAVAVDLTQISGDSLAMALRSGEYDFFFLPRDILPENGTLDFLVTHCDSLSLVAQKGSPLLSGAADLQLLQAERLVMLSESESPILYMEVLDLFSTFHVSPNIVSSYESLKSVLLAVAAGLGVTIVPTAVAEKALSSLVDSRPIEEVDTELAYAMAWPRGGANPAAQLFLQTVRAMTPDPTALQL